MAANTSDSFYDIVLETKLKNYTTQPITPHTPIFQFFIKPFENQDINNCLYLFKHQSALFFTILKSNHQTPIEFFSQHWGASKSVDQYISPDDALLLSFYRLIHVPFNAMQPNSPHLCSHHYNKTQQALFYQIKQSFRIFNQEYRIEQPTVPVKFKI